MKPTDEDFAILLQKFTQAGWINPSSLVKGASKVEFTDLGLRRMAALAEVFDTIREVQSPSELGPLSSQSLIALESVVFSWAKDSAQL